MHTVTKRCYINKKSPAFKYYKYFKSPSCSYCFHLSTVLVDAQLCVSESGL